MDYEKKYKEALERAKKYRLKEDLIITQDIFPELAESEDERISKNIISWLKNIEGQTIPINDYNSALAWLEKQGQVKEAIIPQHENKTCKENGNSLTNEDERIRKSLIILLQHFCKGYRVPGLDFPVSYKDMLAWLEKQGQNPVTWSEEDKNMLEWVIGYLDNRVLNTPISQERTACKNAIAWLEKQCEKNPAWNEEDKEMFDYTLDMIEWYDGKNKNRVRLVSDWLKSLKDRVQPKQEWNEDDEDYINDLIEYFNGAALQHDVFKVVDWLKSLRPQNRWKPSDELLNNLNYAANGGIYKVSLLEELYEQLKEIGEE